MVKRPAAIDAGLQLGLRNRWYPIFESKDLGSGRVEIFEVQPAGKERMPTSDWLRGARLKAGARFT